MKGCNFFFVAGFLLSSSLLGATKKRIDLDRFLKGPIEQIEAFVDEASMQLSVEFGDENDNVEIAVIDFQGNVVFRGKILSGEIVTLPLVSQKEYVLHICKDNTYYKGVFVIK